MGKVQLLVSAVGFEILLENIPLLMKILFFLIALDPAKPWFDLSDPSNTISKKDAVFVDVMHTNSGFLLNVSGKKLCYTTYEL